jgi:hypothetical protein
MNRTFLALLALPFGVTACALNLAEQPAYYEDWAPPSLSGISRAEESGNVGGGVVTLAGSGFGDDANQVIVLFGDANAEILSIDDSTLQVRVPAGPIRGGAVRVRVATERGYADLTGGYTYAIDDMYADQSAYVQVNNYWESCLGGMSDAGFNGPAGCADIAYVGTAGIDGQAQGLEFRWPRFHTEGVGFLGATDESHGEWAFERPGVSAYASGIEELRRDIGRVWFQNDVWKGNKVSCVNLDSTASYTYGGGVEGFEEPYVQGGDALPASRDQLSCPEGQVAYARDVLEYCPTPGGDAFLYKPDWPIARNFFAGSREGNEAADVVFNAPEVGIRDVTLTVPESIRVRGPQGFVSPFASSTPEDYDNSLWGVSTLETCFDDGDGVEDGDDVALRLEWDVSDVKLRKVVSDSDGKVKAARSYVRVTLTAMSLNWFGTSNYPVKATIVVADDENEDGNGVAHVDIPASVLYQFPSTVNPEAGGGGLGGGLVQAALNPSRSDYGYLLLSVERVTDFALATEQAGRDLVVSYATGDFGFYNWTNPVDAAACENCTDDDNDGWADGLDPDCGSGSEEAGFGTTACNNGTDDDGDGVADAQDPDCEGPDDTDEAAPITGCNNGTDDDVDGWIDALDPDCAVGSDELGLGTTACNNGVDDNRDGRVDVDDEDCASGAGLDEGAMDMSCTDGLDNDGDGWLDESDPDCAGGAGPEAGFGVTACNDGEDNGDGDGVADADDPQCVTAAHDDEAALPVGWTCTDGSDDDGDGWVDSADPDCGTGVDELGLGGTACNDGVDNDGDGVSDALDADCADAVDDDEAAPVVVTACQDGDDNDADGWTDAADPDCAVGDEELGFGTGTCNDGEDNDSDGDKDAADSQCVDALATE